MSDQEIQAAYDRAEALEQEQNQLAEPKAEKTVGLQVDTDTELHQIPTTDGSKRLIQVHTNL